MEYLSLHSSFFNCVANLLHTSVNIVYHLMMPNANNRPPINLKNQITMKSSAFVQPLRSKCHACTSTSISIFSSTNARSRYRPEWTSAWQFRSLHKALHRKTPACFLLLNASSIHTLLTSIPEILHAFLTIPNTATSFPATRCRVLRNAPHPEAPCSPARRSASREGW